MCLYCAKGNFKFNWLLGMEIEHYLLINYILYPFHFLDKITLQIKQISKSHDAILFSYWDLDYKICLNKMFSFIFYMRLTQLLRGYFWNYMRTKV